MYCSSCQEHAVNLHLICNVLHEFSYLPRFVEAMSGKYHMERILANHWRPHLNEAVSSLLQQ